MTTANPKSLQKQPVLSLLQLQFLTPDYVRKQGHYLLGVKFGATFSFLFIYTPPHNQLSNHRKASSDMPLPHSFQEMLSLLMGDYGFLFGFKLSFLSSWLLRPSLAHNAIQTTSLNSFLGASIIMNLLYGPLWSSVNLSVLLPARTLMPDSCLTWDTCSPLQSFPSLLASLTPGQASVPKQLKRLLSCLYLLLLLCLCILFSHHL